jgi:acyl carrier protein
MTKKEFLNLFEELTEAETDTLSGEEEFRALDGWSSLVAIEFIALADEKLDFSVSPTKVKESQTINDLIAMFGDRIQH